MNLESTFAALIKTIETHGQMARDYFDSDDFSNSQKTDGSVVTAVDEEMEQVIRQFVSEHFPHDAIIGEEGETVEGTSGFVWHIDPIDGTDNFLRKIPFCAVSIARLGETAEDSLAIVHNPITKHTFATLREDGAYENERVTNLTAEPLGGRLVVSLGVGRTESWMKPTAYRIKEAVGTKFGKCDSYGSTALELAYLAAGRIDAYLTYGLYSYDYAAGLSLVRAAGGAISVFEEGRWQRFEGSLKSLCATHGKIIFASHPDIHDEIRDFIGDPKQWAPNRG